MSSTEKAGKGRTQRKSIKGMDVPEKASFEVPPPPIPAKDIKETVTADVVVLGGGIAGMTASLSAAEAGARTILLEKAPKINYRGGWNAAISSRMQKQAGIEIDKDEVIQTIMHWGSYRTDQRVVKLWADNCSQVMDWLLDMAEAANKPVVLDPITREWYFPHYPVSHYFAPPGSGLDMQKDLAEMLESNGKARGVDFRFETPAVRLLREGKGRVTGVIARNKKGDYIQFNARKAVVLCTGDYGNDHEMVAKYCNWQAQAVAPSSTAYATMTSRATGLADGRVNTGDGHKMGMWLGAAIDDSPHCSMVFAGPSVGVTMDMDVTGVPERRSFFGLPGQPWLRVNINGERFVNEDLPHAYEANQVMRQPGSVCWSVWDSKCETEWPKFKCHSDKNMGHPVWQHRPEGFWRAVQSGVVLTGWTIEELAQKMDVPIEAFKATVARYNELERNGKDLDFGKHPDRLTTLELPPFYACKIAAHYLVILGGLQINDKLQVLDTEGKAIPGLYAAGNVSGSFFADEYPITVPGISHSRAWTFGRLAGLAAAAEKA